MYEHTQSPSIPLCCTSNISLITSGPSRAYDFTPFDSVKMTIGSGQSREYILLGRLVQCQTNSTTRLWMAKPSHSPIVISFDGIPVHWCLFRDTKNGSTKWFSFYMVSSCPICTVVNFHSILWLSCDINGEVALLWSYSGNRLQRHPLKSEFLKNCGRYHKNCFWSPERDISAISCQNVKT